MTTPPAPPPKPPPAALQKPVPPAPKAAPAKRGKKTTTLKLTARQSKFIQEYMIDLNGEQAAIRAGYSQKTAKQIGAENLTKPHIASALARAQAEAADRAGIKLDEVLNEYAYIAFGDIRKVVDWNDGAVHVKDSDSLEERDAHTVCEVSQTFTKYGTNIKVKRESRVAALDALGKYLGMFEKDNKQAAAVINVGDVTNMPPKPTTIAAWQVLTREALKEHAEHRAQQGATDEQVAQ